MEQLSEKVIWLPTGQCDRQAEEMESNSELHILAFLDQGTQPLASNSQSKTFPKKDKKQEEIQKSAEPLDIPWFRKKYPHHRNNHTLIRHIVFSKWKASRKMILEKQP